MILDELLVEPWLNASLALARTPSSEVTRALPSVMGWYRALLQGGPAGEGGTPVTWRLPLFLVLDLGCALRSHRRVFLFDEPVADPRAARLLRRYQHEVLNPILRDPLVEEAAALVAAGELPEDRLRRLLEMLAAALAPCWPAAVEVAPAHARGARPGPVEAKVMEAAHRALAEALGSPEPLLDLLEEFLASLSTSGVLADLLGPAELFELRHFEALRHEELRIGCHEALITAARLPTVDLSRLRPRPEPPEVDAVFHDESLFPAGGRCGLTTRGTFESLVPSELVYAEPGAAIDPFDVRMVENELLYFVRDEGRLRRRRRAVVVLIDWHPDLRTKPPEAPCQLGVLAQAFTLALWRELSRAHDADSLRLHVRYLHPPEAADEVAVEARVLEVLLQEERARGRADRVATGVALPSGELAEVKARLSIFALTTRSPELMASELSGWIGDRREFVVPSVIGWPGEAPPGGLALPQTSRLDEVGQLLVEAVTRSVEGVAESRESPPVAARGAADLAYPA